jgi:hypothetical protein
LRKAEVRVGAPRRFGREGEKPRPALGATGDDRPGPLWIGGACGFRAMSTGEGKVEKREKDEPGTVGNTCV